MDIHPYVISPRSELDLKNYIFMENDKINPLKNLFQYLLSSKTLFEWKFEFILPDFVWNFQINGRNKPVPSNILPLCKASSWIC